MQADRSHVGNVPNLCLGGRKLVHFSAHPLQCLAMAHTRLQGKPVPGSIFPDRFEHRPTHDLLTGPVPVHAKAQRQ